MVTSRRTDRNRAALAFRAVSILASSLSNSFNAARMSRIKSLPSFDLTIPFASSVFPPFASATVRDSSPSLRSTIG
jgi:hypothetical protein